MSVLLGLRGERFDIPMGTNLPSRSEPFKWKYQLIWLRFLPSQSRAGVTPEADLRAEVIWERVKVLLESGVIPA